MGPDEELKDEECDDEYVWGRKWIVSFVMKGMEV